MANVTHWKAGIAAGFASGTVGAAGTIAARGMNLTATGTAAYWVNTGGTAYGVSTGLGSVYKITGGTGQLVAGSLGVTPALSVIVSMSANRIRGTAPAAAGTAIGTAAPLECVWAPSSAGATAAVYGRATGVANDGSLQGTAWVSWLAFGY